MPVMADSTLMRLLNDAATQIAGPKRALALRRWAERQDPRYQSSLRRLATFRDRHAGQRCFILGNGPSLNHTDLSLLRNEVTFGLNRIYMHFAAMGFSTTYHVAVNELVVAQCSADIARLPMPKFVGWHCRDLVKPSSATHFLYTRGGLRSWFFTDVTEGCWEGSTVTMVALQLAFHMGFSEAILVGVDHSYEFDGKPHAEVTSEGADPNHFDAQYFGKGFRWHLPDLEGSEMSYRVADFVYRQHGRRVTDATVGGKLTVFPKVEYASLFGRGVREAA